MFPREQRACDDEASLPHDVAAIRSLALHRPLLRLSTVPLVVMANIAAGCSGGGDAQSTATGSFTGAAVPPSSTTSSTTSTSPSATLALPTTPAPPSARTASRSLGYKYSAMWTIDSLGWQGLSPEAIVAAIRAAGMQPGTVADVI